MNVSKQQPATVNKQTNLWANKHKVRIQYICVLTHRTSHPSTEIMFVKDDQQMCISFYVHTNEERVWSVCFNVSYLVKPFSTSIVMEIVGLLTCCCDAVKAHKGVEAGGGTRQNSCNTKRSKTTTAEFLLNSERQKKRDNQWQIKHYNYNLISRQRQRSFTCWSRCHWSGLWSRRSRFPSASSWPCPP